MIDRDDLVSLSWEQRRKYSAAIDYGFFDDFELNHREWKHTFIGSMIWKYPQRCATINRLKDIVGHLPTWEDLTDDVLRDFVDETSEAVAASSTKTICAELKAVLNANRRKIPSEDFMTILNVKGEASQAVYLTRQEAMRIANYTTQGNVEAFVRRNFMVEFLTGARLCDAVKLSINNCNHKRGTLSYVPRKTPGIIVTVPVDEKMKLRNFLADTRYRICCTDTFNDILRRICRECHIDEMCTIRRRGKTVTEPKWKLVSSHTARRSFATNLFLAGVSLEDIAMLMGHGKNIETTKRYICAERPLSDNVLAYFQEPKDQPQSSEDEIDEYEYDDEELELVEDDSWLYEPMN